MKKIMVLDGHSLVFRAFHAIPELVTSRGTHTNAIYGFITMLMKIISEYSPNAVFVAFDLHAPTFRHKIYKDYKAGRSSTPEQLLSQIEILKELLKKFGITVLSAEGFEADDILGTLSAKASAKDIKSYLVTGDRDSLQLINDNTTVLYTKKGVSGIVEFDRDIFVSEYEISPEQFVDCKALMGDSSDNIPGVAGIGQKTAVSLLRTYNTLDGIYSSLDEMKPSATKTKLESAKDSAYLSRTLAEIVKNAPVELPEIQDEIYAPAPTEELCGMLEELELVKILEKIGSAGKNGKENKPSSICKDIEEAGLENVIAIIKAEKEVSVFASGADGIAPGGCVLWTGTKVFKANCPYDGLCIKLREVFEDESVKKYLQDIKCAMHTCAKGGFEIKNAAFDYTVAAYLLDAVGFRRDLDYMASKYVEASWKNDVSSLTCLKEKMEAMLSEQGMLLLYRDIEHPLIEVLFSMEEEGFCVDTDMLLQLGKEYDIKISQLKQKIYGFSEYEFNINSTKQLGDVLFGKLKLPVIKKTKTGYSTDNEVLEQLRGTHEIIELIINYRQLTKLKSTYIDGLCEAADENGKVHTTFNQTVTNTGRLSSTDPNLQNIPVRTEEGSQIRKAFVAGGDYVIADADYSQIELRMFAHMSGDEKFIDAFVNGEDIHRKTASDVFSVPYDEVTDALRGQAKAVNFGIIYGISDFGLAKNLSVSRAQAKSIINDYMQHFPTIGSYMEKSIEFARTNGYCKTIYGRRRSLEDIHSRNFMLRSAAERIAVNMPVQGSAADVIKVAMINVFNELKKRNMRSKLILQVHDELVVRADINELEDVMLILKDCMENAVKLDVPLVADIGSGPNWGDAKA